MLSFTLRTLTNWSRQAQPAEVYTARESQPAAVRDSLGNMAEQPQLKRIVPIEQVPIFTRTSAATKISIYETTN